MNLENKHKCTKTMKKRVDKIWHYLHKKVQDYFEILCCYQSIPNTYLPYVYGIGFGRSASIL